MNGAEVRSLRERYRMSVGCFGELVGVSMSTVYRWEASPGDLNIEPMSLRIMRVMADTFDEAVSRRVASAIAVRGGLYGLYVLLKHVYQPMVTASLSAPP